MVQIRELTLSTSALLLLLAAKASASLYPKFSAVLQLDANTFDKEILRSNHAAMVEFFAPWCGHCKSLAPAYEKAAKSLKGLAKVAAVNCDEDKNKAFCGSQGIQGFPTLKLFQPSKKPGKPIIEDYQGPRTAKAIVDAVVDKIPNHVDRVTSKELTTFLAEGNDTAKAILFTAKGATSALYKALAIDFLGSIKFAQIRDKETEAANVFGVTEFPKLIVLPGGEAPGKVFEGEMKRDSLFEFLKSIAPPPKGPVASESKAPKKEKKAKAKTTAADESVTASTESSQAPLQETPQATWTVPDLTTGAALVDNCFSRRSHICILAIVEPPKEGQAANPRSAAIDEAFQSRKGMMKLFKVPAVSGHGKALIEKLGLSKEASSVVAVNSSKRWYKKFPGETTDKKALVDWLDAVKLGEGKKEKIPEGYLEQHPELKVEGQHQKPLAEEPVPTAPVADPMESPVEAVKEPEAGKKEHDEL